MENADLDIKYSKIPETAKYSLIVIIKGITSFPWVFFFVGLILTKEYFFYWFVFFLAVEGVFIFALIYVLIMIVKASLKSDYGLEEEKSSKALSNSDSILAGYLNKAKSGIIGNIAFYVIIIGALLVLKFMGVFDAFISQVFDSVSK